GGARSGLRTEYLNETRGSGQLHHVFEGYEPWIGELRTRSSGSLVADRRGLTSTYALLNLQERGSLFVGPGVEVYEGMIVGENARADDLDVNATKEKKLTNMRAASSDETVRLIPPRPLSLEQALELIREDECVEVTPLSIRLRKVELSAHLVLVVDDESEVPLAIDMRRRIAREREELVAHVDERHPAAAAAQLELEELPVPRERLVDRAHLECHMVDADELRHPETVV